MAFIVNGTTVFDDFGNIFLTGAARETFVQRTIADFTTSHVGIYAFLGYDDTGPNLSGDRNNIIAGSNLYPACINVDDSSSILNQNTIHLRGTAVTGTWAPCGPITYLIGAGTYNMAQLFLRIS